MNALDQHHYAPDCVVVEVKKPLSYSRFSCPKCGSHKFGTHKHTQQMGNKYLPGTLVGTCNEHEFSGNGCDYEWRRGNVDAESECMKERVLP